MKALLVRGTGPVASSSLAAQPEGTEARTARRRPLQTSQWERPYLQGARVTACTGACHGTPKGQGFSMLG